MWTLHKTSINKCSQESGLDHMVDETKLDQLKEQLWVKLRAALATVCLVAVMQLARQLACGS